MTDLVDPEPYDLDYAQTPAVFAEGDLLFSGLLRTEDIVPYLRARFGTGKVRFGGGTCAA